VEPFDQIILPWKLYLHASTPTRYSSLGIVIASLSPLLTTFCGNCGNRISQRLMRAGVNVFYFLGWFVVVFRDLDQDPSIFMEY